MSRGWRLLCLLVVTVLGSGCRSAVDPQPVELETPEIVRRLSPSVVRIQVGSVSAAPPAPGAATNGFGTGIILDPEGHIMTNHHVLLLRNTPGIPDRIRVTLHDRRLLAASLVGSDPTFDLAVLKIQAHDLIPATFGDSDALEVGQDVVAVGYALDLRGPPTVTRGVISALRRRIVDAGMIIPDAIQTDAGINPGNSGGPLVDRRGRVIGVNAAVVYGAPHIGFAISASFARVAAESLIRTGQVERAYLGVVTLDSTVQIDPADYVAAGIPVSTVTPGSPAESAGLRDKDTLLRIDGEDLITGGDLLAALVRHRPGETVTIEFRRGTQRKTASVTLARHP